MEKIDILLFLKWLSLTIDFTYICEFNYFHVVKSSNTIVFLKWYSFCKDLRIHLCFLNGAHL